MKKKSERTPVHLQGGTEVRRRQLDLFEHKTSPVVPGQMEQQPHGTPAFHEPVGGTNPDEPKGTAWRSGYIVCVSEACLREGHVRNAGYEHKPLRKGTPGTFRFLGRCQVCRTLVFGERATFDPGPEHTLF